VIKRDDEVVRTFEANDSVTDVEIDITGQTAPEITLTYSRAKIPDTGLTSGSDGRMLGAMLLLFGFSGAGLVTMPRLLRRKREEA